LGKHRLGKLQWIRHPSNSFDVDPGRPLIVNNQSNTPIGVGEIEPKRPAIELVGDLRATELTSGKFPILRRDVDVTGQRSTYERVSDQEQMTVAAPEKSHLPGQLVP
jgi:hypothetical protein